jgi:hypothetical protein
MASRRAESGEPNGGSSHVLGVGLHDLALPGMRANSPHLRLNRQANKYSNLSFDLQSPLTESNRRPSPYHKYGPLHGVLSLHG